MNDRLKTMLEASRRHNPNFGPESDFGLSRKKHYDVLVAAPGWKPTKIIKDASFTVRTTASHSYISGYEVEKEGFSAAWIQTASGAGNILDRMSVCLEMNVDKLVFIGAVGGLAEGIQIGELCTPACSIDGTMAGGYLQENLQNYRPFETVLPPDAAFLDRAIALAAEKGMEIKKRKIFCTDSIFAEYAHLPFIRSTGAECIEMETAAFYRLAALWGKPAMALHVVSDNSAVGQPLIGMPKEQKARYHEARCTLIPRMIELIGTMEV